MKTSRRNGGTKKKTQPREKKLDLSLSFKKKKAFVDHYYATFDTNRAALGALYSPAEATLTFEGQKSVGQAAILTKLTGEFFFLFFFLHLFFWSSLF